MTPESRLLPLLAEPGQPETLYRALQEETQRLVGHKLFTLLYVDGPDVARVWSSRPAEYPTSGRKTMGETPWGAHVLRQGLPYLGRDKAGIRWAFYDHALIEGMGLGAVINLAIRYDGETIGTLNLLDVEHAYDEAALERVKPLAPLLVPAFLEARRRA